ncbi:hypothetical protein [Xanthocytophaga flava]|uniref:hypothetical protein n=1 Tax=Xanthocytophaga flava TaxID=3048013 RepID=UPI0028D90F86|nr:hypothetical protein [Xanthocytophaga flavus]MDJ1472789.1 hypothetical protein [Xanthocytophaga flavus]
MKSLKPLLLATLVLWTCVGYGQIDKIKKASHSHSPSSGKSSSGDNGRSGNNSAFALWAFWQAGKGMILWQMYQLNQKDTIPSIISLDVMPQVGIQPPDNYWLLPRIRGNWGLFSMDFRYNFLMEDDALEGKIKSLGTFDWQIVQLNFVNTRPVTVRAGFGTMIENFGDHNAYFEWTLGGDLRLKEGKLGGGLEYRATESHFGIMPRREINARVEYQLFQWHRLKGYGTLGGIFQRYYSDINVWGMQTGFIFRLQ